MLGAFGDPKNTQSPMGGITASQTADERIKYWMNLIEQGAPPEQIEQAEMQVAEVLKQQPFIKAQLPFAKTVSKMLDSVRAFGQFRLPGSDRVVVDRRDHDEGSPKEAAKDQAKEAAKDAEKSVKEKLKMAQEAIRHLKLKDGKLVEEKQKTYTNYLGDRSAAAGLDREAASERVERLLSVFEKMVIARFEDGKKIVQETPDGKPKFLEKTEGQWRDFFKAFLDRTLQKKVLLSEIREFLLRGLVSKGNKAVFIGDMQLVNGQMKKFVRFSILAEALAKLKAMTPGDAIGKNILGDLAGEELMYLALAVSRGREFAFSNAPTQGKFMGSRAEADAAQALGLPVHEHLKQKAKMLKSRQGGAFGKNLLGEDGADDVPYKFIPWWHWGRLTKPGKSKLTTIVFYLALLILSLIGIGAVTLKLLGG